MVQNNSQPFNLHGYRIFTNKRGRWVAMDPKTGESKITHKDLSVVIDYVQRKTNGTT